MSIMMSFKKSFAWLIATVFVVLLSVHAVYSETRFVFKAGTLAPNGVGWSALIKKHVVPKINQVTKGVVSIDIFWGGIMGDDEDYILKMRNDQLQSAGFSGAGVVQACPEMAVLELPFLFNNPEEVELILTKYRDIFAKLHEKRGYKMLYLLWQDFDEIYSSKYEFRTPDDFKKSRILTWYGKLEDRMLRTLGASPIPVNVPEAASNMRSGVTDAMIAPAIWTVGTQLYQVSKYVNTHKWRFSPATIVVSQKAWDRTVKGLQDLIQEAINDPQTIKKAKEGAPLANGKLVKTMESWIRQKVIESNVSDATGLKNLLESALKEQIDAMENLGKKDEAWLRQEIRKSNVSCLNAMIKYGVKEVKMTTAEVETIKKRVTPLWDQFANEGLYPKELLKEIKQDLATFRAQHKP
jgi:TRAP-type C4-dicarboxylate transport system substrate-binding protein